MPKQTVGVPGFASEMAAHFAAVDALKNAGWTQLGATQVGSEITANPAPPGVPTYDRFLLTTLERTVMQSEQPEGESP